MQRERRYGEGVTDDDMFTLLVDSTDLKFYALNDGETLVMYLDTMAPNLVETYKVCAGAMRRVASAAAVSFRLRYFSSFSTVHVNGLVVICGASSLLSIDAVGVLRVMYLVVYHAAGS